MKKWLLVYIFLPFVAYSQDMDLMPYKSTYFYFLQPKDNTYSVDTSNTGYSNLQYHSFSSKGQFIKVNHQQLLTDYLLLNINFKKFSQEGIFNRENIKLHDVSTSLLFKNQNQTYSSQISFGYQKIILDENGGITNYATTYFEDPLIYQVNLLNAQNEAKNRNHKIVQNFQLTKNLSIQNKFSILSHRKIYTDQFPQSGFYQNIYLDSTLTFDSLSTISFSNDIGITYNNFTLSQIFLKRGASINNLDSSDYNYGLSFSYRNNKIGIFFNSQFYKTDDINLSIKKEFNAKMLTNALSLDYIRSRVPILTNFYYSNHFFFDNDFANIKAAKASYIIDNKNYSFKSIFTHYLNYIYLDEYSHYQQYQNALIYWHNKLTLKLNWKRFHTIQILEHQYSDNSLILPYPKLNYTTSLWFESSFFSDNLNTKIGADMNYFTSYFAMAYNPALANYHLQDSDLIGDTPLISVFLKLHVQNMNITMRYRNIASLISANPNPYYLIPNYPYHSTSFQLSVVWKLNNLSN
tara:strand:+ start:337 stop:1896 length:1560 start_codon:yes stop_codon:yes gene_type:complete